MTSSESPSDDRLGELAEDFVARRRRGERPTVEEYAARYPEMAPEIHDLFPTLLRVEDLKAAEATQLETSCRGLTAPGLRSEQLGDFRIVREVGRGGMGIVYEAEQVSLGRRVALKVLPIRTQLDTHYLERFRRKARAAARLHHAHIVPVYGVGEQDGVQYYVMQFIQGRGLDNIIAEARAAGRANAASLAQILSFGIQAAEALAYAHAQGVLHRDVKPSNLLLDPGGHVWITDFGLAKTGDDKDLTQTGDIVGTLRYLAPERFGGVGDARSDIYALGLTLYELLTLRPAFEALDQNRLIQLVLEATPAAPRRLNPAVPRDLETVLLKATAREPARRYASAADFAEDLQRVADDRPIRARRTGVVVRLGRWSRRNPALAGALAALIVALLGGFAGVSAKWLEARAEREAKEEQRLEAVQARDQAEASLYNSLIARAQLESRTGHLDEASRLLGACPPRLRGWEWDFLTQLGRSELLTLRGHRHAVSSVAFSPDGRCLASAGGGDPLAGPFYDRAGPSEVILWDAGSTHPRRTIPAPNRGGLYGVAYSPDGKLLAAACRDNTARIFEVATGRELHVLAGHESLIEEMKFSLNGLSLATASKDRTVRVWDIGPGATPRPKPSRTLRGHAFGVKRVTFDVTGSWLTAVCVDEPGSEIKIWNLNLGLVVGSVRLEADPGLIHGIAISPDGRLVAAGSAQGISIWKLATGRLVRVLTGHAGWVMGLAFSPDGRYLASAGDDWTVRVWHLALSQEVLLFRGHQAVAGGVSFSPDGNQLASASHDGTVKVWDLTVHPEYRAVRTYIDRLDNLAALGFTADSRRLVLVQRGGLLTTVDSETHTFHNRVRVDLTDAWPEPTATAAFDGTGRLLAGVSRDDARVAKCWDVGTGHERAVLRGHRVALSQVAISSDGRRVATAGAGSVSGGDTGEVTVWEKGRPVFRLVKPGLRPTRLALSPSGERLALAGIEKAEAFAAVFDVATGREIQRHSSPDDVLHGLAFSSDGQRVAAAGAARHTLLLLDLQTGQARRMRHGVDGANDLSFSPDGRRLAVAGWPEVKLLDAASGEPILVLRGLAPGQGNHPTARNGRVCFSPDGRRLAAITHNLVRDPVSAWSVGAEESLDDAARWKAAERRGVIRHLREVIESRFYGEWEGYRFHLARVRSASLANGWEHYQRARMLLEDGQQAAALADLEKAEAAAGGEADYWILAADVHAKRGEWSQAAAKFSRSFALGASADSLLWRQQAILFWHQGNAAEHRRICAGMFSRFSRSESWVDQLYVALACGQAPGGKEEPARLLPLAERATAAAPDNFWAWRARATICYRAGRHEDALRFAQKALQVGTVRQYQPLGWVVLALANQHLGKTTEARRWLDQADRWLAEQRRNGRAADACPTGWAWWDWLELLALRREAARPIGT